MDYESVHNTMGVNPQVVSIHGEGDAGLLKWMDPPPPPPDEYKFLHIYACAQYYLANAIIVILYVQYS